MISTLLNHTGHVIDQILDLMAIAHVFSLAFSLLIFWKVGEYAVRESHTLRRTGLGVGLLGFLAFLTRIWTTSGMRTGADLSSASLRALFCAGFITSLTWMVLTILAFLYKHTFSAAGSIMEQR